jgi:NADPH:quinone reductase-like Zn-dependent oxidoreductase
MTVGMKAMVQRGFGLSELRLQEIDKPSLTDDGVLVRVHAASVNPLDWYSVTGRPYLFRPLSGLRKPKSQLSGVDFAGTVEAVGSKVKRFRSGDQVFGAADGSFAEYVCVAEHGPVVLKPSNLTFDEAAAVPVAAVSALQAVRDKGGVHSGQKVLINGAAGGVGTFAVQIAKLLGADVTAVCSTANVDAVRLLGADRVVDYKNEDFSSGAQRYEVMIDIAGGRPWRDCRRVLTDKAVYVIVGGPGTNRWLGPLSHVVRQKVSSLGASQKVIFFIANMKQQELVTLCALIESGHLKPIIDRRYELRDLPAALNYLGNRHARAKVVIDILPSNRPGTATAAIERSSNHESGAETGHASSLLQDQRGGQAMSFDGTHLYSVNTKLDA